MKIVIDMPSHVKNRLIFGVTYKDDLRILVEALNNGTPLPKQHGDLIDKDRLLDELEKTVKSVDDTNKHLLSWDRAVAHVHLSKPIIAADGGGENEISD